MDYIEGSNLAGLVRDGPLDSVRAARYVKLIAEAIHVAHENGVLHRDLKPQNVLVDSHDQPHITDFGLAKQLGGESGLTVSGAAVGTPSYMPPEQASGRHAEVTRASDVYSLGAILYALLTAQAPFRNDSVLETITDVIHKEPTPPRTINPKADRDLETICLTCLQKKAARRYPTAGELADDLGRYLNGEPIRAKPIGPLTRAWHWIRHIPLVAAMTGSRHGLPTPWQRRAGWALLLLPWLLGLAILGWRFRPETLPVRMRIASAAPGGLYHEFAQALG
jgi:serine/threonine protein kinase